MSLHQPYWVLILYYPVVAIVLVLLFCVSCRDPGLMERVTVSRVTLKLLRDACIWIFACIRLNKIAAPDDQHFLVCESRMKKLARAVGSGTNKLVAIDHQALCIVVSAGC